LNTLYDKYLEEWINLYVNENITIIKIADKYHVSLSTVWKYLKKNNIYTRNFSKYNYNQYKINENFFEKIDNSINAYILGFLYADGHMYISETGSKQVRLKSTDINILKKISKLIYIDDKELNNNKLYSSKHKESKTLIICNKKIYDDLYNIGMHNNKTFDCYLPHIDEKYMSHFIRGFFDGDGCIYYSEKNRDCEVQFTGTLDMCNDLKNLLSNINIHSYIVERNRYSKGIAEIRIRRKYDVEKFYMYIYDNMEKNDLFLNRKREKFENMFLTIF
jgi:intein-encoded DNA endonuclease-like protein